MQWVKTTSIFRCSLITGKLIRYTLYYSQIEILCMVLITEANCTEAESDESSLSQCNIATPGLLENI